MTERPARHIAPPGWMTSPAVRAVCAAIRAGGGDIRFVGGCVRDALLLQVPEDIDLATPEPPDRVIALLRKAGIRAVPTGLEHGTITAIVPPEQFQITTLREDVETDGRHAKVRFGRHWAEDAARRDFTINALYADGEGGVFDYVGGLADITAGMVRFIGDPGSRVREDYLRVLRFFRFHARFGGGDPDAASLQACAAAAGGLQQLSAERVRDELVKLLSLPNVVVPLGLMDANGVLQAIMPEAHFLPGPMAALVDLQRQGGDAGICQADDPWIRLALLVEERAGGTADRLHLSNAQRLRLERLTKTSGFDWEVLSDEAALARRCYDIGPELLLDRALLAASKNESAKAGLIEKLRPLAGWRRPVFPLRGADLLRHGLRPSPSIGSLLNELEAWWRAGNFAADREQCLAEMRARIRLEEMDAEVVAGMNRSQEE